MMEEDEYEDYDSDRDRDHSPVKDPSVWRNGPAKLFFDQLGIPSEGDLDYNSVLLSFMPQRHSEEEEKSDEVDGACPAPVEQDGLDVESECGARRVNSEELELAVQSILLRDAAGGSATVTEAVKTSNQNERQWSGDTPTNAAKESEALLKQRISEQEVSEAVDALVREMNREPVIIPEVESKNAPETFMKPTQPADFNLVSQVEWEKDVVWNPESEPLQSQESHLAKLRQSRAGWIPTVSNRKFEIGDNAESNLRDFKPIFSLENDNLIKGDWEKDIIWDVDTFINQCPQPKILYFDATDEQIVFQKPKEVLPSDKLNSPTTSPSKASTTSPSKKAIQPHAIKSKLLLGKAGFIQWKWQMEQQELKAKQLAAQKEEQSLNGDQKAKSKKETEINYNLSNDEFYVSKDIASGELLKICALNFIRHSKVILDFLSPFMTTYLSEEELKNFHRPQLKSHSNAPRYSDRLYKLSSCYFSKMRKARERDVIIKDGHPVLLDKGSDLTGTDGELVLIENSEEHPPLLSQVGMCSKIINYYKRKSLKEYAHGVPHPYGETIFVYGTSSPFLGYLEPGQVLTALENNMYRAPIYHHSNPKTDFILIINKNGYFVREFDAIFTAGQQCPLIEVPEPNSTRAKTFLKNLLLVTVYRKFSRFPLGTTARIKLSELSKSFPGLFESTIKSWLKSCAEIKKIGTVTWVVMKSGFVLPDENELKELVTPEQCCAYYSLLAAEKRLKDAGCDSMLSLPERVEGAAAEPTDLVSSDATSSKKTPHDSNDQITQSKLAEELKVAPWNTTAAFVAASKGKCLLQVTGPADPTGCGEGFSYIRVAKKGAHSQLLPLPPEGQRKRTKDSSQNLPLSLKPGGTAADLRKLSSKQAKEILRRAGVPDKEITKLSRWEVIDVLRTLSMEKAKQGETDEKGMGKFCRWKTKTNSAMNQERYREDCQRVFDLQNKVLSSNEVLSTDEEEDDEDVTVTTQEDIQEMGKNLEQILKEGKTASQLAYEEEELERLELQKMMLGGIQAKDAEIAKKAELFKRSQEQKKKEDDLLKDLINNPGRKLKISRTFKENGKTFLRTEIVRDPVVIAAYLKIRTTKSEEFIKDFLQKADRQQRKEEKLKEKMLLDELQDKRVVQNEIVKRMQRKRKRDIETEYFPNKAAKQKAQKELVKSGRKCGACGLLGHTRTNPICPLNNPEKLKQIQLKKVGTGKRGRGRPPMNRENYGQVPVMKPPKLSKQMVEVLRNLRTEEDLENQPSSSSDEGDGRGDDRSSDYSDSSSDSGDEDNGAKAEDQTMVKVDGLKMVLKVPQRMVTQAQLEEQQEEEAARILLSISNSRRRGSTQQEREHADYLNDRSYKTTAADRVRKKE